jgi:hypothetical protein
VVSNVKHISHKVSFKQSKDYDHKTKVINNKNTYLEDWLKRLQANNPVPDEVVAIVKEDIDRSYNKLKLNEKTVKVILGKYKLSKYYDNIIYILNKITGRPNIILDKETSEKVTNMFYQITEVYRIVKPPERKNTLSYSYLLNKIFMILDLPEFAQYFPMLEGADKTRNLDEIFVKIIDYLKRVDTTGLVDWRFFPSF